MAALEELKAGTTLKGLSPSGQAKVVQVEWFGDQAVKITFEDSSGIVQNCLVYRNEEDTLEVVATGRPWSFDGDGSLLRLVSEAYRLQLAPIELGQPMLTTLNYPALFGLDPEVTSK